jgi:hypothetical protein
VPHHAAQVPLAAGILTWKIAETQSFAEKKSLIRAVICLGGTQRASLRQFWGDATRDIQGDLPPDNIMAGLQ